MHSPDMIPARFTEAWNERDADKIAAIFDENAEFVNVVGIWWHSREEIRKAHDYGLRVIFNESTLITGKVTVKKLSSTVAVVHARMILKNQSNLEGKTPGGRQTIFSFVVHKKGEEWSCASAQNTDIVPGKETHFMDPDGNLKAVDYRESEE
ncbi:SgcJ/EcaC family oxidoreductase [Rhodohalobacter sp. SW132]|nr:SgcJ/EcaC family oxidoreductase [Rhodohalobacter sp. SW132]